jgi:transposase InsO family protein
LIQEACNNGARKHKACEILGISIRTLERWSPESGAIDKRKEANRIVGNKLTPEERTQVLVIANSEEYRDVPPCKIVPMLADNGEYIASESSFYRILREEKQLTHRATSKPAKHKRPTACTADGPNKVWTWDISYLPSQILGQHFYLYMIIDVFSRKIVGWSIHEAESAEHASHLIKQACIDEGVARDQLILHSDNGSPMKGATMLAMLQVLGVMPSFSRPSVSDDNPYSEALFKTVKYHPTFPAVEKFKVIEDARKWCIDFVAWYNQQHLHSGLKFITPHQRHTGEDKKIMEKRNCVYQAARRRRPDRWSGNVRSWQLPSSLTLNPDRKQRVSANNGMSLLQAV